MAPKQRQKQKIKSSHIILVLVLLIGCAIVSWLSMVSKAKDYVPEFTQHLLTQAQEDAKFAAGLFATTSSSDPISISMGTKTHLSSSVPPTQYSSSSSLISSSSNLGTIFNQPSKLEHELPDLPTMKQQIEFIKNAQESSFKQQIVAEELEKKKDQEPIVAPFISSLPQVVIGSESADTSVSIPAVALGSPVTPFLTSPSSSSSSLTTTSSSSSLNFRTLNFVNAPINLEGLGSRWPYFIHFHKGNKNTYIFFIKHASSVKKVQSNFKIV
jgi:hypothetical protein